ncbi:DedA family protein [Ignatzschineria indica]|uniref:YqaA family protein n=1 Tax=Ignatzschineria indica TaxID=472583 RepID=UPI002575C8C6|nr:VTT domain-containing protein [Ignatzschineria indica]MDM1544936.1 DedA family protein [Ignatzschineria indica]
MEPISGAIGGLLLLALSAFSSATILPGSSEVALLGYLHLYPEWLTVAFVVATIFNTLGSISMYWVGRIIPERKESSAKVDRLIARFGLFSLLFSSLPIIGDFIPIAAGWFRLNFWYSSLLILVGKAVRYLLLLGAFHTLLRLF